MDNMVHCPIFGFSHNRMVGAKERDKYEHGTGHSKY